MILIKWGHLVPLSLTQAGALDTPSLTQEFHTLQQNMAADNPFRTCRTWSYSVLVGRLYLEDLLLGEVSPILIG